MSKTRGALSEVNFREGKKYFSRLLLKVIPKATSFNNLKTVNRNVMETFQETCRRFRFLDDFNT